MNPASTVHVTEQPSPGLVLPSSQSSPSSMLPLPQLTAQACVLPEASRQLGSRVQVVVQPVASPRSTPLGPLQPDGHGPLLLEPQSQASLPSFMPLPQTLTLQTLGVP